MYRCDLKYTSRTPSTALGDISFLSEEYQDILNNVATIRNGFKLAPRQLDFLRGIRIQHAIHLESEFLVGCRSHPDAALGIVTDLFVDKCKLNGQRVKDKQKLRDVLENYNYEDLVLCFE